MSRSVYFEIIVYLCTVDSAKVCCTQRLQCESIKNPLWGFLAFFPEWLGIFSPNFTRLFYVKLQIFIQLSATLTKLCHIKRNHLVHIICSMFTIGWNVRWHFLAFFPNSLEFLVQILHTYYTFLSMLDCIFLPIYPHLWPPIVRFNRWWTCWAYNGGRT